MKPQSFRGAQWRVPQAIRSASTSFSRRRYDVRAVHLPGTTGFDVVGSWGWLRAEVPGGLVKHPEKPYVRTLTSTPSPPSKH